MSWHFPVFVSIREEPFKNYLSRTAEKWKAKEDKIEEVNKKKKKKKKKTKKGDDGWNAAKWQPSSWSWQQTATYALSSSSSWQQMRSDHTIERSD